MSKTFYEKHKQDIERAIANDEVMTAVKKWVNHDFAYSLCPIYFFPSTTSCTGNIWNPIGELICQPFFGSDHSPGSCPCDKYSFQFVKRRVTYLVALWEGKKGNVERISGEHRPIKSEAGMKYIVDWTWICANCAYAQDYMGEDWEHRICHLGAHECTEKSCPLVKSLEVVK